MRAVCDIVQMETSSPLHQSPTEASEPQISCRPLVSLIQMKDLRSENIHLVRRTDPNLFIGRSNTGLKELLVIFAYDTDKSVVRIGKRIDRQIDFFNVL